MSLHGTRGNQDNCNNKSVSAGYDSTLSPRVRTLATHADPRINRLNLPLRQSWTLGLKVLDFMAFHLLRERLFSAKWSLL